MSKEEAKAMKARFKGKEFLLKGRMVFAKLLKPHTDQQGKTKYSMMFFWKDDCPRNKPIVDEINKLVSAHKNEWYPKHPNFIYPIKHYDTYEREDGQPNYSYLKGCYWINASANKEFPPAVFDHNKQRVTDDAELTDGRDCLMSFQIYPYNVQKVGIGASPRAVILLPGGEIPYGNEPVDPDKLFGDAVQAEIDKAVEKTAGDVIF